MRINVSAWLFERQKPFKENFAAKNNASLLSCLALHVTFSKGNLCEKSLKFQQQFWSNDVHVRTKVQILKLAYLDVPKIFVSLAPLTCNYMKF